MDAKYEFDPTSNAIIGCALKIHRFFGPGVFEKVYEIYLAHELKKLGYAVERQVRVPVEYDGIRMESAYRIDLLVNSEVIVEIKAVETMLPIHHAQLLSYLRLSGHHIGLLINFHEKLLKRGLKRIVL
jgi:GxxExxY protein